MARDDVNQLWNRWIDLWNGDLAQANEIIHPEFTLHRIPAPLSLGHGQSREGLLAWINQTRYLFPDLVFTVEVGPIVDGESVAGRWIAEGTYQGGIPGSTMPAGTRVGFHGNDIWRAEDGLVREFWLSDDLLDLMEQLGTLPT